MKKLLCFDCNEEALRGDIFCSQHTRKMATELPDLSFLKGQIIKDIKFFDTYILVTDENNVIYEIHNSKNGRMKYRAFK